MANHFVSGGQYLIFMKSISLCFFDGQDCRRVLGSIFACPICW